MKILNTNHSPFLVIEEFISPLLCEEIVDNSNWIEPNYNINDKPIKTEKSDSINEQILYNRLLGIIPTIESHFNVKYKGTQSITFEWVPQGANSLARYENCSILNNKLVRTKNIDFTAVLFLCDYTTENISEFECYGGKLEFPQFKFGFNPQKGTLIIFPSDVNFLNSTSQVLYGDLFQSRIQLTMTETFYFSINQFPGNYTNWFY